MKYNVTLQVLVNVRVPGIEAENENDAAAAAEELVGCSTRLCDAVENNPKAVPIYAEWVELSEDPAAYALVTEVGDTGNERSVWYFNHPRPDGYQWEPINPTGDQKPMDEAADLCHSQPADTAAKLRAALARIAQEAAFTEDDGAFDLGERLLQISELARSVQGPTVPVPTGTCGTILGMPIEDVDVDAAEGGEVA